MSAPDNRAVTSLLRGVAVSRGIAHGTAFVLACESDYAAAHRVIAASEAPKELERFKSALAAAQSQIGALQRSISERLGPKSADLFTPQSLILRDPVFVESVSTMIADERINAEAALSQVIEKYASAIDAVKDAYLRERSSDVRDVGRRILSVLGRREPSETIAIPAGSIVIADELFPSATAHLEMGKIRGFATERGGKTSHAAILARSSATPAVTGLAEATNRIKTNDYVIVDGYAGVVLVNPKPAVIAEYTKLEAEFETYKQSLQAVLDEPSRTRDGTDVALLANIGKIADGEAALLFKAEGVGLYRTEFFFLVRPEFPSEEDQFELARRVGERFAPRSVVFRVLDIGADKNLPYFPLPPTANPALAERGIRLLLKHKDILRVQLRALLRASALYPLKILLPMVGGLDEADAARAVLEEEKASLKAAGVAFNPDVPLGAMIETPGAAWLAPQLARRMDFLSLGTNDLVQYTLAADRDDPGMTAYYDALHPAVLAMIANVCEAAGAAGKPLSICGDIAGDPLYTALLLGLGLRSFSVAPGEILEVKSAVRSCDIGEAEALARRALAADTAAEVLKLLPKKKTLSRVADE